MVEQVWVWPLGCVNIFLNQGALDGMQFCIMIRHDLWAFLITSDWGGGGSSMRISGWNVSTLMHPQDESNHQVMTWINWGWKSMDRGLWMTQFLPILMWSMAASGPKWRTNVRIEKNNKKRYTCWAQASRLLFWWTYSRSDHTRVVLFILYCYEYLKSSACLLKQFF